MTQSLVVELGERAVRRFLPGLTPPEVGIVLVVAVVLVSAVTYPTIEKPARAWLRKKLAAPEPLPPPARAPAS